MRTIFVVSGIEWGGMEWWTRWVKGREVAEYILKGRQAIGEALKGHKNYYFRQSSEILSDGGDLLYPMPSPQKNFPLAAMRHASAKIT